MRLRSRWIVILIAVVAIAIAGWSAFDRYWFYLPGLISEFRDPIGPNHEVTWEKGPDVPAAREKMVRSVRRR